MANAKTSGFGQVSGKAAYQGFNKGKVCLITLTPTETKGAEALYTIMMPYPGRFHFADVMAGKYRLDAALKDEKKTLAAGSAGVIDVKERQTVEDVSITLTEG
jgi:hypothetical protein